MTPCPHKPASLHYKRIEKKPHQHYHTLSPSLYIQQELESLSADQISSTHTNTPLTNTDISVSHSPNLHTHVNPRSHSDPHTSRHTSDPHSHTDEPHSRSDPQLLTNGITLQEDTRTDETHSHSNGSRSCTDETRSHTDEPNNGKLLYKMIMNLLSCYFSYSTSQ